MAANLPGRARPEDALSFRWKNISPTDPLTFKFVTSALLQGKLLSFCYYSPSSSNCSMRTVEPHHMVNYMGIADKHTENPHLRFSYTIARRHGFPYGFYMGFEKIPTPMSGVSEFKCFPHRGCKCFLDMSTHGHVEL